MDREGDKEGCTQKETVKKRTQCENVKEEERENKGKRGTEKDNLHR